MSPASSIVSPRGASQAAGLGPGRPWRRVLVYGMGVSGRAATRLLLARGVGVYGVDARPAEELDLAAFSEKGWLENPGLTLLAEDDALPGDIEAVILSPGVPPERPLLMVAREHRVPILSEVELAFPLLDGPMVGITGSNGKSTTTAMTGAMLRQAGRRVVVCGNIGDAVSSCIPDPGEGAAGGREDGGDETATVYVVELSSYQLETVDLLRPRAAALLNLSPDHLERYGDMDAYGAAKANIFRYQQPEDVAILNADDPRSREMVSQGRRRFFSRTREVADGCHLVDDEVVEVSPAGSHLLLFRRSDLPLPGAHNLENAMAAALLARALGAEPEAIRRALAGFDGLPYRMQRVLEAGGVTWYDDSKATNFAAVAKSLVDLPDGRVHLILGGKGKGDDPAEVVELARTKAKRLYLVGASAEEFADAFEGAAPIERCGDLEHAVPAIAAAAQAGDVALLSPACASFDQFDNFAHRGRVFQELVRRHAGAGATGETTGGAD